MIATEPVGEDWDAWNKLKGKLGGKKPEAHAKKGQTPKYFVKPRSRALESTVAPVPGSLESVIRLLREAPKAAPRSKAALEKALDIALAANEIAYQEFRRSPSQSTERAYEKTMLTTSSLTRKLNDMDESVRRLHALREAPEKDQSVDALIAAFGGGGSGSAPKLKKQKSEFSPSLLKVWADSLRKAGEEKVDSWRKDPDPTMRKMARDDAADMKKIARMIETGNITKAKNAISSLDTIVREEIPNEVWDGLGMSGY